MSLVPRQLWSCASSQVRAAPVAPEGATNNKGKCPHYSDSMTGQSALARISYVIYCLQVNELDG